MSFERIHQLPPLPPRPSDGHKGLFGRVLIVGGNDAMIGAPVLAGTAALRSGSGLVQIAVPQAILHAALSIAPELIGLGLRPGARQTDFITAAKIADAIAVGPGMGQSAAARSWLMRSITIDKPIVIDADALNMLAAQKRWPTGFNENAILTPHPGEMKRLAKLLGRNDVPADDEGRIEIAFTASRFFKQIIVLKGHRTVVTDGARVFVNRTGDSTLSKAGSVDVLSGILAALIGQGMHRFDAACAAVHIHGRAGEIAGKKLGRRCALARDVIDAIPQAVSRYDHENS